MKKSQEEEKRKQDREKALAYLEEHDYLHWDEVKNVMVHMIKCSKGVVKACDKYYFSSLPKVRFADLSDQLTSHHHLSIATECAICLETYKADDMLVLFPCSPGHFVHKECGIWACERKFQCPFCRSSFYKEKTYKIVLHWLQFSNDLMPWAFRTKQREKLSLYETCKA